MSSATGINLKTEVRTIILRGSHNYLEWSRYMVPFLVSTGLWGYVTGTEIKPEPIPQSSVLSASDSPADTYYRTQLIKEAKKEHKKYEQERTTAYFQLYSTLAVDIQVEYSNEDQNPKSLWDSLKRDYASQGFASAYEYFSKLSNTKLENRTKVEEFTLKFRKSINELSDLGIVLPKTVVVILFLMNLSGHYKTWTTKVRTNIGQLSPTANLPELDDLVAELHEEARLEKQQAAEIGHLSNSSKQEQSQDLEAKNSKDVKQNREKTHPICKTCSNNHPEGKCYYEKPENASETWKPRKKVGKFKDADLSKGNTFLKIKEDKKDASSLSLFTELTTGVIAPKALMTHPNSASGKTAFVIDSGATVHMCNDLNFFVEKTQHVGTIHPYGSAQTLDVPYIGTIRLPLIKPDGSIQQAVFVDVLYVPEGRTNLISVDRLRARGVGHDTGLDILYFIESGEPLATLTHCNLWFLNWDEDQLDVTTPTPWVSRYQWDQGPDLRADALPAISTDRWHQRLGHQGIDGLKKTAKATVGMNLTGALSGEMCEVCELSKAQRHVSYQHMPEPNGPFDVIYSDILTITPDSHAGHKYAVIFIDAKTRCRWIYFIKRKSGAFRAFQDFCMLIKTQADRDIKALHIDNDGSYGGLALEEYCADNGILIRRTAFYTPEQNGVAERTGGLIAIKTRALMLDGKIPARYWDESAAAAVYLLNRSANSSIGDRTPNGRMNMFLNNNNEYQPIDISNLRVFGCKAFVTIPKETRVQSEKIKPRAHVGKLIGYEGSHNYKILLPDGHIEHTPHVTFDESSIPTLQQLREESHLRDQEGEGDDDDHSVSMQLIVQGQRDSPAIADFESHPIETVEGDEPMTPQLGEMSNSQNPVQEALDIVNRNMEEYQQRSDRRGTSIFEEAERDFANDSTEIEDEVLPLPDSITNIRRGRTPGSRNYQTIAREEEIQPSRRSERSTSSSRYNTPESQGSGTYFTFFMALAAGIKQEEICEPKTFKEAMKSINHVQWIDAMKAEIQSQKDAGTYKLVKLPPGQKAIDSRWVLKHKRNNYGEIKKFKARLVAKGFTQKEGVDFFETYASVAKSATILLLLCVACLYNLEVDQLDVVTAFLNGDLDERIYMRQPEGFHEGDPDTVWLLLKAIYGLKQASRQWYQKLNQAISRIGLTRSDSDNCLFYRKGKSIQTSLFVVVHVDDIIVIGQKAAVKEIKQKLSDEFKINDLGPVHLFLGLEIQRDRANLTLTVSQQGYIEKILDRFGMSECRPADTPMEKTPIDGPPEGYKASADIKQQYQSIVGSIMYASTYTRIDTRFAVAKLSRFLSNPTTEHLKRAKHVLRYLKGSPNIALTYRFKPEEQGIGLQLSGYTDADFAGDAMTGKSTSGYVFTAKGTPISWQSGLQSNVAQSSCESEYYGLANAVKEALWFQHLLTEIGYQGLDLLPIQLYEDNRGAVALAHNPEFHKRTKHIANKWHFVRDHVNKGDVKITYLDTKNMPADGLTKPLDVLLHQRFLQLLNIISTKA